MLWQIQPTKDVLHVSMSNNLKDLNEPLQRCKSELVKFACLNDEIDYTRMWVDSHIAEVRPI